MGSVECSERIEVHVWYCVAAIAFGRLRMGHTFLLHSAIGDDSCLAFPVPIPPISRKSVVISLWGLPHPDDYTFGETITHDAHSPLAKEWAGDMSETIQSLAVEVDG